MSEQAGQVIPPLRPAPPGPSPQESLARGQARGDTPVCTAGIGRSPVHPPVPPSLHGKPGSTSVGAWGCPCKPSPGTWEVRLVGKLFITLEAGLAARSPEVGCTPGEDPSCPRLPRAPKRLAPGSSSRGLAPAATEGQLNPGWTRDHL